MKELLQEMAILLGFSNELELLDFCRRERLHPAAPGVTLSPTREAYLMWLEQYQKRTVTSIEIQPPNCPSALLNWTTMLGLFQRLSPQQQEWIRHFPVSPAQWQAPGVDVVDAHCHLDMLAQRWRTSPGEALRRCIEQAPEPRMNLLAIVSNCCFPKEWCQAPRVSGELGVRVALTFGVHPRVAVGWEDRNSLQQRVESQECVAVGECGLDYIRPGRQQQRRVFRGQIRLAKSTGKPWYCIYGVRREVTMKSTWKLLGCFWRRDYHADIPFIFIVMWPAGGSTLHGSVASAMSSWGSVPKQPKLLTLRSWHGAFHSRGSAWRVMRLISIHFRAGSIRLSCCITRQD